MGIATYGSVEWGELEAAGYVQKILDVLDDLTTFPRLGQVNIGQSEWHRSIGVGSHVIFYRVDEDSRKIEIVRILHARMDARRHLGLS